MPWIIDRVKAFKWLVRSRLIMPRPPATRIAKLFSSLIIFVPIMNFLLMGKFGWTFFHKGLHTFLLIGTGKNGMEYPSFKAQAFSQAHFKGPVNRLFNHHHRGQ